VKKAKRILELADGAGKKVVGLAVRAWGSPVPAKVGAGVLVVTAVLGTVLLRRRSRQVE
jgi:hypothetical protein